MSNALSLLLVLLCLLSGLSACTHTALLSNTFIAPSIDSQAGENTVVLVLEDPRPLHRQRGLSTPGYTSRQAYDADPLLARTARSVSKDLGVTLLSQWPIRSQKLLCLLVESNDPEALIRKALKDKRIKMAQPFNKFETLSAQEPFQHLQAFDSNALKTIAPGKTGKAINILVIDTFADVQHEDLRDASIRQFDFVGKELGFEKELHGTAVVGVLSAKHANGIGIAGIAPHAGVQIARACWQTQASGAAAACNTLTLSAALDFAIENDFDILNLSLSGPYDPLLEMLLDTVIDNGAQVITAFDPNRARDQRFPKWRKDGGVLFAMGAHARVAELWPWEIAAPYSSITLQPNDQYDVVSGHSIAAPHIAGVAALLLEGMPELPANEIGQSLQKIDFGIEKAFYQAK
ncbi:MAG: S8 family serine peptidase [Pseudomonadota bacterium]